MIAMEATRDPEAIPVPDAPGLADPGDMKLLGEFCRKLYSGRVLIVQRAWGISRS